MGRQVGIECREQGRAAWEQLGHCHTLGRARPLGLCLPSTAVNGSACPEPWRQEELGGRSLMQYFPLGPVLAFDP